MSRPEKLKSDELVLFLDANRGWTGDEKAISRTYKFAGYAEAVGFTVAVAMTAERRDHHPDIHLSWGKVLVEWSTHDAGGVTTLDVELGQASDALYAKWSGPAS